MKQQRGGGLVFLGRNYPEPLTPLLRCPSLNPSLPRHSLIPKTLTHPNLRERREKEQASR